MHTKFATTLNVVGFDCIYMCLNNVGLEFDKLPPNVEFDTAQRLLLVLMVIVLVDDNPTNFESCPWSPVWRRVAPFVLHSLWNNEIMPKDKMEYLDKTRKERKCTFVDILIELPEDWDPSSQK